MRLGLGRRGEKWEEGVEAEADMREAVSVEVRECEFISEITLSSQFQGQGPNSQGMKFTAAQEMLSLSISG